MEVRMMSSIGFFHDHKVIISGSKIYSRGGLSPSLIQNYQKAFGNLIICTRVINASPKDANLICGEEVSHHKFPDLLGDDFFNFPLAFKTVSDVCEKSKFVIARLPSISGLIACWYLRNSKERLIVEVTGCAYDSTRLIGGIKGKLLAPILYFLVKYFVRNAKNVSYVTQNFLQDRYKTNASNILSASDVEINLDPEVRIKRQRKFDNPKHNNIKMGMIGNYNTAYKGYSTSFRALKYLDLHHPGIYSLDLVGGGDSCHLFHQAKVMEIDHCVRFLGILDFPDEVFLWLDTVDIFLHPSETEGLPRALVEANSRGCAAIGSNVGGIPELLSEDMIIEPKDHVNLRNIIINMSSNSKLRMESISSFKRAANYEYSKLNKKRFAFYKKVKEGILHD